MNTNTEKYEEKSTNDLLGKTTKKNSVLGNSIPKPISQYGEQPELESTMNHSNIKVSSDISTIYGDTQIQDILDIKASIGVNLKVKTKLDALQKVLNVKSKKEVIDLLINHYLHSEDILTAMPSINDDFNKILDSLYSLERVKVSAKINI